MTFGIRGFRKELVINQGTGVFQATKSIRVFYFSGYRSLCSGCPLGKVQETHFMVREGTGSLHQNVGNEVCNSASSWQPFCDHVREIDGFGFKLTS